MIGNWVDTPYPKSERLTLGVCSLTSTGKRLTVVQLLPALESGGVERGTLEVAQELVRLGHRSMVISAGGPLVDKLIEQGSEHIQWNIGKKSPMTLLLIRRLRKLLLQENVNILHARSRVPGWVGYLAWKGMHQSTRPRFVTTVHSIYSVSAFSRVMTYGERVIAISRTVEEYIAKNYPKTDPARIRLVYRGIDASEFPHGHRPSQAWLDQWHQQYPNLKNDKIILTVPGRIVRRKGHLDFARLLAEVRAQGIDAHGLFVGGEDANRKNYSQEVRDALQKAGVADHVTFTGNRSDIRDIYAISDIVYVLSAHPVEAFGRTTVEALSLGVPAIGYDLGGVSETLGALFPRGRVPLGDVSAAVERTMEILRDKPVISPNRTFLRRDMLDRTMAVYAELIDEQGGGT